MFIDSACPYWPSLFVSASAFLDSGRGTRALKTRLTIYGACGRGPDDSFSRSGDADRTVILPGVAYGHGLAELRGQAFLEFGNEDETTG